MPIEITVPRSGWSMEEGTFAGWLKQDGETVKPGDRVFALESDKAIEEVELLDSGILRIPADAPKTGDRVKVGQVLGYLVAEGEVFPASGASPAHSAESPSTPFVPPNRTADNSLAMDSRSKSELPPQNAHPSPAQESPLAAASRTPVTPRARRAAVETGVALSGLQGTGRGGRIRERDVRSAAPTTASEIPVTALRRKIAERMMHSRSESAPVTLTCRVDATNLVALRNQFKATAAGSSVPAYTDIVAKLVAIALQQHPVLAGRWESERILLPATINIGIAVDTEQGLLVPVVHGVSGLPLAEISRRTRALVEAAHARRLRLEDLQGGVFTITNLGALGIEAFTPIINSPETAILGLGAIRREAVALENGSLTSRDQMTLSLTFDHRVVDGAPAARFLQTLREGFENPASWLLNNDKG